jgi:hypothetical protein
LSTEKRSAWIAISALLFLACCGCGTPDQALEPGMMNEAQHTHYHVHAADASHEHSHSQKLGGHTHTHSHNHSVGEHSM